MGNQHATLDYKTPEPVNSARPIQLRWTLWWPPPIALAVLGAVIEPIATMRTGDPGYRLREQASGLLWMGAFVSLPLIILIRVIFWMRRKLKSQN